MLASSGQTRRSSSSPFPVRTFLLPSSHTAGTGADSDLHSTGAFTPGCQARHLPPYIEKRAEFKAKGVDIVAVIASNDVWVMNAWGKVNGVKNDDIVS